MFKQNRHGSTLVIALGVAAALSVGAAILFLKQSQTSKTVISKVVEEDAERIATNFAMILGSKLKSDPATWAGPYQCPALAAPAGPGPGSTPLSSVPGAPAGAANYYLSCNKDTSNNYYLTLEKKASPSDRPISTLTISVSPTPLALIYTVSYSALGADAGTPPVDITPYSPGAQATVKFNDQVPPLTKAGFSFSGWNTMQNGSGTDYAPGAQTGNLLSSLVLFAKWGYTVKYFGNGATGGIEPVDNGVYPSGGSVTVLGNIGIPLPLPAKAKLSRTGYTFANWNTAANGTGTTLTAGSTFPIAANTRLYAKWTVCPATTPTAGFTSHGSASQVTSSCDASRHVVACTYSGDHGFWRGQGSNTQSCWGVWRATSGLIRGNSGFVTATCYCN